MFYAARGNFSKVCGFLQGSHTWVIEAEGYAAYSLEFTVAFQQETADFAVYLIPADGVTRAVLRL